VLIKNGVLESAALKLYDDSLKSVSNFFVGEGEMSLDEIVASIKNGILMNNFFGDPKIESNGFFSGTAEESLLIRDGKITNAVQGAVVSGNFTDMLDNITAISSETIEKEHSTMPWIAFGGVTISGK
jgi:predicted Zn-dependent protease